MSMTPNAFIGSEMCSEFLHLSNDFRFGDKHFYYPVRYSEVFWPPNSALAVYMNISDTTQVGDKRWKLKMI